MRILIITNTMGYLSGAPMYYHSLAKELVKRHEVSIFSDWSIRGKDGEKIRQDLEASGVKCLVEAGGEYDVCLASHHRSKRIPTINIVHSEYDCETPLEGCDAYICIRPSIKEHIVSEHGIPASKCFTIYNGVDISKFRLVYKQPKYETVAPCTLDPMREKFLNHLIDNATEDKRVLLVGDDYGAELHESPHVDIRPATFDIAQLMAQGRSVSGILLGRVNLEARAMNLPSYIYDPVTLEKEEYYPDWIEFTSKHDIKNVCNRIEDLINIIVV